MIVQSVNIKLKTRNQLRIDELIEACLVLDEAYFREIIVERYKDMMY